jgi:hypothetical protein
VETITVVFKLKIQSGVLRFDNGVMFKLKTMWYIKESKGNSDLLAQEREVWRLILDQKIDDVKARGIKKALKNRIENFTKTLYENLDLSAKNFAKETKEIAQEVGNDEQAFKLKIEKRKPGI